MNLISVRHENSLPAHFPALTTLIVAATRIFLL